MWTLDGHLGNVERAEEAAITPERSQETARHVSASCVSNPFRYFNHSYFRHKGGGHNESSIYGASPDSGIGEDVDAGVGARVDAGIGVGARVGAGVMQVPARESMGGVDSAVGEVGVAGVGAGVVARDSNKSVPTSLQVQALARRRRGRRRRCRCT